MFRVNGNSLEFVKGSEGSRGEHYVTVTFNGVDTYAYVDGKRVEG